MGREEVLARMIRRPLLALAAIAVALVAASPADAHRTPKGVEATAIKKVLRTYVVTHGFYPASVKLRYEVRVSTVNPRMAGALVGGSSDAVSLVLRNRNGRWSVVSNMVCMYGPPAVRADLWESC
jgi:hypothetical protein